MKVKKLISLLLAGSMMLGTLVGCGGSSSQESSSEGTAATESEGVEISFWNPFTGDDGKNYGCNRGKI